MKIYTVNLCKGAFLKKYWKLVFKTNYRLLQVKSMAECSKGSIQHSAILSTFIKLPFVIKILVLSILSGRFTQVLPYQNISKSNTTYPPPTDPALKKTK